MAKLNPPTTPPSSIRFLRNLSAISRTPTPSCAILAVLASLVASVNPFPVGCHESNDPPPSFLCPSLEPQAEFDVQEFVLPTQTPPPTPSVPGPSGINRANIPTPVRRRVRRNLAPGYTQGEDGRWRKLSTWSLYGSTICVCHDASGPTGNTPVDDLATTPPPSSTSDTDLLPSGWSRTSERSVFRTTLILSLSLVLAALIVVFIIAFLLWRRKRREGLRKDVEKKLVKRRRSQSIDSEKESRTKSKSKLWARATTRWRENVRQSARRRRNARLSTPSLHPTNNSTVSLHHTTPTPSSPHSRSSSFPPSRVSSPTPTISTAHSILTRTDHESHNINIEPPSPSPPSSPALPPAYQGRALSSFDTLSVKDPARLSPSSSIYDPHSAYNDSLPSDSPPPSPLESDMSTPNLHIAHVATDDKAVLRQMEVLSSRPPTEPGSSCDVHGSAPVLYEDDVQSLEYAEVPELAPSSVGFPLPPTALPSSKGKAAALEYYDYDDLDVDPDPQPSAPPFEAEDPIMPSAPPQGEAQFLPSAPPEVMDSDDDPTAPPDDGLSPRTGGQSVDATRQGSSRPEPLPQYQP